MIRFKVNSIGLIFMFLGQLFGLTSVANNPQIHKNIELNSIRSINSNSGFVKNTKHPGSKVKYFVKSPCFNIYLYENGFSYEFVGIKRNSEQFNTHNSTNEFQTWPNNNNYEYSQIVKNRVDILFENALPNDFDEPSIINFKKTINRVSYSSLPEEIIEYKIVRLNNIYKNIDIEYQYSETGFKYNFIIKPGGDLNDIKLAISGAKKTSITEDGFINIEMDLGIIKEHIPLSYIGTDSQNEIALVQFNALSKNTFGFKSLSNYLSKILTIDPSPIISYFGDSLADKVTDMVSDENGNIYLTGLVNDDNDISFNGIPSLEVFAANNNLFIAKFDSINRLIWISFFGGEQDEKQAKICLDKLNNIYILSASNSDSGIATNGSHQINHKGNYDIVLLKLNPQGIRVWATFSGTFQQEAAGGICIDKFGDIVISGQSRDLDDSSMVTIGYPNRFTAGIVQKFNNDGVRIWGVCVGDYSWYGNAITIDEFGNIYGTGYTQSDSNIATNGAFQTKRGGLIDGLVFKLLPNGHIVWSTYIGGNDLDYLYSVACDKNCNVVVSGHTSSNIGIASIGAYQPNFGGGNSGWETDGFLVKLDSSGQRIWSTYFGKGGNEYIQKIAIDSFSNIYLGGNTSSPDSFATSNAYNSTYNGGDNDGFLAVFTPNCKLKYSTYIGGTETDYIFSIALHKNKIHFGGITNSSTMFASTRAYDTIMGGSYDGFFGSLIYNQIDDSITNNTIGSSQIICSEQAIDTLFGSIPIGGNGSFNYKWIASIVSDSSGFVAAGSISSLQNYKPSKHIGKMWYRRIVYSGTMVDTSNVVSIVFANKLNAGFTINKQIQCLNTNQFIFSDTTFGSNSHFWDFGNGDTSTLRNPVISYKPRIYNGVLVKLYSSINGNCADTAYQTIYLINNPQTSIITGDTQVMRLNLSTYSVIPRNGSTYQWYFTKGTGSGNSSLIQIKWKQIGVDTIRLIEKTSGGCFGDTIQKIVQIKVPTELNETDNTKLFQLFPNPSSGIIEINHSFTDNFHLQVVDVLGRNVHEIDFTNPQNQLEIDLTNLSSGTYFIIIKTNNGFIAYKNIQINRSY